MTLLEMAKKLRTIIENAVQTLDDATALDATALFPDWHVGMVCSAGQKLRFLGVLYTVLQPHTAQVGWTPPDAPSLYAKVLVSVDGTILDWEQPDSTNGYMTGARVRFNGAVYESLSDNNIWSPEAYPAGWKKIEEE